MHLVPAAGDLLERVLDETHSIWHKSLSRRAYGQLNAAQMRSAWSATHLQRYALVDDAGALLSTAKRYRLEARMGVREVPVCGIGAVFTPPDRRGRGYASALIDRLIAQEEAQGAELALLFSEIGEPFYERLGFRRAPIDEVAVTVRAGRGAPATLVRAGHEGDLPALAAMHDVRSAGAGFALRRSVEWLQYSLAKKRLRAGLGPPGASQVEFFVVEEGVSAVAYIVLIVTLAGWTLVEAGDRDPAGARLGALLQVLMAREPSLRAPRIRAWWPRAFPVPPQVELTDRRDPRDVMMLRALADVPLPARAEDVFYWRSDHF